MRLVRFDSLAPGGAALEVHPRLTLLRGASPELGRRLAAALRALAGDGELHEGGVIEVSGVRLGLDAPTVAQLRVDVQLDPVLRLAATPAATAGADLPPPVEVVSSDEVALRDQLREVGDARTELGRRMDRARTSLDSFASAALEVCIGQIEALESRRAGLRVDWEHERDTRSRELERASAQLAALRATIDHVAAVTTHAPALRGAVEAVQGAAGSDRPDPAAVQLAARLDAAAARVRDLHDQRHDLQGRLDEAGHALTLARSVVDEAERHPQVDRAVVQRLEAVRDEIFAVDDRQGVLGSARHKRRLAELRSEEAILLDRLGFDTYSAYVMGIRSVRAEMERDAQLVEAREHADRLEAEVAVLRAQVAERAAVDEAERALAQLLAQAAAELGETTPLPPPTQLADDVVHGTGAAALVHRVAAGLRDRRAVDAERMALVQVDLDRVLAQLAAALGSSSPTPPEGPVAVPELPAPPAATPADAAAEGSERLELARRWSAWLEQLQGWLGASEAPVVELERLVAELGGGHDDERIARWAEVEAELDEALDRLAAAQERVRAHDAATGELAALRTEELALRDRERDLLARIAEADSIVPPQPVPPSPPLPGAHGDGSGTPPVDPDGLEWWVVARLARQRAVSFIGSVPVLVEGLPVDAAARDRVLGRLDRLSDLVQVVVLTDDDTAAAWAAGLGERGRRIDL